MIYSKEDEKNETGSEKEFSDKDVLGQEEKPETSIQETKEGTPAEKASQIGRQVEKTWKRFLFSEKMITIGALVGIISFFLPWISIGGETISGMKMAEDFGWLYLYPLLMLVSLGLIYFTQGASKTTKILTARWQILIGSIFAFKGVVGIIAISAIIEELEAFMGPFGRHGFDIGIGIGIGWWLLTLSAIAILVGAFKLQKKLLK